MASTYKIVVYNYSKDDRPIEKLPPREAGAWKVSEFEDASEFGQYVVWMNQNNLIERIEHDSDGDTWQTTRSAMEALERAKQNYDYVDYDPMEAASQLGDRVEQLSLGDFQ